MARISPFQAFHRVRNQLPYPEAVFFARKHVYWHRVGLTDTAGSNSPGTLTFFNAAKSSNLTNLPQAGRLPSNHFFAIEKIGIFIEQGRDIAGNAEALAAAYEGSGTSTAPQDDPADIAEAIRLLYQEGIVNMTVGNRKVVEDVFGLHNFPWGSVPCVDAAFAAETTDTTATLSYLQALARSGDAHSSNGWWFDPSVPIFPDKQIEFTINWSGLTLDTLADLVVRVGMFGQLLTTTGF